MKRTLSYLTFIVIISIFVSCASITETSEGVNDSLDSGAFDSEMSGQNIEAFDSDLGIFSELDRIASENNWFENYGEIARELERIYREEVLSPDFEQLLFSYIDNPVKAYWIGVSWILNGIQRSLMLNYQSKFLNGDYN
jgi:hypothetical protein